jgi:hypothetical protein
MRIAECGAGNSPAAWHGATKEINALAKGGEKELVSVFLAHRESFVRRRVVVTGQEFPENDERVRLLDFSAWEARRRRLAELGGPALPLDP